METKEGSSSFDRSSAFKSFLSTVALSDSPQRDSTTRLACTGEAPRLEVRSWSRRAAVRHRIYQC